jgi:hypothetical protein
MQRNAKNKQQKKMSKGELNRLNTESKARETRRAERGRSRAVQTLALYRLKDD